MTERMPYSAGDLGFSGSESRGWTRVCRGVPVRFAILRTLEDLLPCERLQFDVFGISERDLVPANELVVVPETGGDVFGAYVETGEGERMVATLIGWGGFTDGRPRIVSDFLAVEPAYRNLGLGADLKRLQAAVALGRGIDLVVWTVDPLRAPNARLNFEKLGATSHVYERNRYGDEFGAGLYGGMPTDRLHVDWEIASNRVRERLLFGTGQTDPGIAGTLPLWSLDLEAGRALVELPADVDALLVADRDAALSWRMTLREILEPAFEDGWRITGFIPRPGRKPGTSLYLLDRADAKEHR